MAYLFCILNSPENHLPVDNQIFGGSNLGTVVVIPVSSDVPLANFAFELSMALNSVGKNKGNHIYRFSFRCLFLSLADLTLSSTY